MKNRKNSKYLRENMYIMLWLLRFIVLIRGEYGRASLNTPWKCGKKIMKLRHLFLMHWNSFWSWSHHVDFSQSSPCRSQIKGPYFSKSSLILLSALCFFFSFPFCFFNNRLYVLLQSTRRWWKWLPSFKRPHKLHFQLIFFFFLSNISLLNSNFRFRLNLCLVKIFFYI